MKNQLIILWIGIGLVVLAILFPPFWHMVLRAKLCRGDLAKLYRGKKGPVTSCGVVVAGGCPVARDPA